jgi:DNA-binding MarR family transcriptional regulator
MGAIAAALQSAGLVAGAPDPKDGRKTVLSLTDMARQRFADGRLAREDWLHRAIVAELTVTEQAELTSLVGLLRRIANAS